MAPAQVGHIVDRDFAGLGLADVDENEFQRQAGHGLPLVLPWNHRPIRLGVGYHSDRQLTADPWASATPFLLAHLMLLAKIFRPEQGTTSSFTSRRTMRVAETNDHLTLGFGVSVAPPVPIVKLSVKGDFDQQVQENRDADKLSLRATCRTGCIDLEEPPRLTAEAVRELKYGGGFDAFCERYGDYYVAGYRVGGDTGLLVSASASSRKEIDQYKITAKGELCGGIISKSKSWTKDFEKFRAERAVKLLGYDTLEGRNWINQGGADDSVKELTASLSGKPLGPNSVRADADAIMERSQRLTERVEAVLEEHGVHSGSNLTFRQCEALVEAGVIIELLLLPMARLRDVIRWRYDDNII